MNTRFKPSGLIFGTLFVALAVIGIINTYVPMNGETMLLVLAAACIFAGVVGVARMALAPRHRR